MTPVDCLSQRQLHDFSLGLLLEAEDRRAISHLESCPVCQTALVEFDDDVDSMIEVLRADRAENLSPADPEYVQAVERVVHLGPGARPATVESKMFDNDFVADDVLTAAPTRLRDYCLVRKLGSGGMGAVYEAIHTRLQQRVAVKVLTSERMRDRAALARFQREMRAIGSLNHPSIVRATDAGDSDGTHFLVMEYVEGLDLSALAYAIGPLSVADACGLIRQAAEGLEHVHARGMVHRDIKPSNLMLTPEGKVKILDLGLALLSDDEAAVDERSTIGHLLGTLDYMAPEQADDSHQVDGRADVYSLGATLYRLLAGSAPFSGPQFRSPLRRFRALALLPVPPVTQRRDDVPPELAALVECMLAKSPAERIASPAEVSSALLPFCTGHDLVDLLQRGLSQSGPVDQVQLPARQDEAPSNPASLPVRSDRGHVGGRGLKYLAAGAVFLLLAFLVVQIQTDKGQLIVRTSVPDISVQVRRSGKIVEDWQLDQGENRTTLRSGNYEIVLSGDADGLVVRDGNFQLMRGDQHIATIESIPEVETPLAGESNVEPAASAPEPTYGGKTFEQWEQVLSTERQAERLSEAITAMTALAKGGREKEAAGVILENAGKLDGTLPWSGANALAARKLRTLYTNESYAAFASVLQSGGSASRLLALSSLIIDDLSSVETFPTEETFLAASHDPEPMVRAWALAVAAWQFPESRVLRQRLEAGLSDPDLHVVYSAAVNLHELEPSSEGLADALLRVLQWNTQESTDSILELRASAGELLAKSAPDTQGLVPAMLRLFGDVFNGQIWPGSRIRTQVQLRVCQAFIDLGPRSAPLVPLIIPLLEPRRNHLLLDQGAQRGVRPFLVPSAEETDRGGYTTRILLVEILGAIGPVANTPEVIQALEDVPKISFSSYGVADARMRQRWKGYVERALQRIRGAAGSDDKLEPDEETSSNPTYRGKTFEQWAAILRRDEQPEMLSTAIDGLAKLGEEGRQAEALAVILEQASRIGSLPETTDIGGWKFSSEVHDQAIRSAIRTLSLPGTVPVLEEFLKLENSVARCYIVMALYDVLQYWPPEDAQRLVSGLLAASQDSHPLVRGQSLFLVGTVNADFPQVRERLQDALDDSDDDVVWIAAAHLGRVAPQTPELVTALNRVLHSTKPSIREWTKAFVAKALSEIDPTTEGLADDIASLLQLSDDPKVTALQIRTYRAALIALRNLGERGSVAAPKLRECLENGDALGGLTRNLAGSRPISPVFEIWPWKESEVDARKMTGELVKEALAAIQPEAVLSETVNQSPSLK